MPDFARSVKVVKRGRSCTVEVDGEEFPWLTVKDSVTVDVRPSDCPTITLTILAERVEVDDRLTY